MKAILSNKDIIECGSFDETNNGFELHDTTDGTETIAFIPHEMLIMIVPDEYEHSKSSVDGVYTGW